MAFLLFQPEPEALADLSASRFELPNTQALADFNYQKTIG